MRVGLVFHKDPLGAPTGIDLVRLRAIALGLAARGVETDIRIVRVVDKEIPERDTRFRNELLECQTLIKQRAQVVILNNTANLDRWRLLYGDNQLLEIVPTGCRRDIPLRTEKPYHGVRPVILFLGSLAAPRMVRTVNALAEMLQDCCEIHLIGSNKSGLYGSRGYLALSSLIHDHGEMPESYIWPYVEHASIGLALATGPHVFDNDLSKMFTYFRGGLPVLSEDTVLTNYLITETGGGSWQDYLARYRISGDKSNLDDAVKLADVYLNTTLRKYPEDFSTSAGL